MQPHQCGLVGQLRTCVYALTGAITLGGTPYEEALNDLDELLMAGPLPHAILAVLDLVFVQWGTWIISLDPALYLRLYRASLAQRFF
jgi:hypothetical protein